MKTFFAARRKVRKNGGLIFAVIRFPAETRCREYLFSLNHAGQGPVLQTMPRPLFSGLIITATICMPASGQKNV